MDLANYEKMDVHLLVGLVNTELRNHADDLTDLVKTHGLDEKRLVSKLAEGGYVYQPEIRQVR